MSPATSGISQFSMSSGNQINDLISASNSNSPTVGLEFSFDQFDLDGHNNFTF
ncbi:hypothetical protein S245_032303, partial [Arachis hypogaea]